MSGEPKPLTQMTPREAWEHAWEQAIDACRVFEEEAAAKQLEAVRNLGRQMLDQDQEEEGVPVVARDEAAAPKSIGWDDVTEEHVVGAFLDAQAEAHRYRNALEALLNSAHRGICDAAWALEAVANAEALISPGLDDDYRKAKAQEAYERRLTGGESEK